MSKLRLLALAGATLVAAVACGESANEPFVRREDGGPDPDARPKRPQDAGAPDSVRPDAPTATELLAGVVGTDYVSPGVLGFFHLDSREFDPSFMRMTGSCPIIRGFSDPATFGLANRYGGNTFQTVNPIDQTTSDPISTGENSNPWDLVLVGAYAYVARYDLGDVAKISRESGAIERTIGLSDYVDNDPRPGAMLLYRDGTRIAVALQNLLPDFSVDSPGVMAIIDSATDEVVQDFEIGYNPNTLAIPEGEGVGYVSHTGSYADPVNFPPSVDEVNLETGEMQTIALNGVALGNPTDIAVSATTGYVVGGFPSKVFTFSRKGRRFTGETAFESTGFASEIVLAGARLLAVDAAGLWVREFENGMLYGPFPMTYPTVSVAVVEVPKD